MTRRKSQTLVMGALSLLLLFYTNCSSGGFEAGSFEMSSQQGSESNPVEPPAEDDDINSPTPPGSGTPTPSPSPSPNPNPSPPPSPTPTPTPTPTPPGSAQRISVVMASGHMGRTVMSCDGGRSWINDRSDNDRARCWVDGDPNYVECDHTASSSVTTSIAYGNGYFFTAYGWGFNGTVRRTRDGVNWDIIYGGSQGGGVAFANNSLFILRSTGWFRSLDFGGSWISAGAGFDKDSLSHPLPQSSGNSLFAAGRDTGRVALAVSRDGGATWQTAPTFNPDWSGSFVTGNGLTVALAKSSGLVAVSADGGLTWTNHRAHNSRWGSNVVFREGLFVAWSGNLRWTSADGRTWSSASTNLSNISGHFAYNAETNSFAHITDQWGQYYAAQKAYHSTDGLTWTQLNTSQFRGGHPIRKLVVGEIDRRHCP